MGGDTRDMIQEEDLTSLRKSKITIHRFKVKLFRSDLKTSMVFGPLPDRTSRSITVLL
jgi:hypothetical protein